MYISGFIEESIVDGEGVRSVVFISGCKHACKGCFNKETWDFKHGKLFTEEEQDRLINRINKNPLIHGLTISGGDPIYSYVEVIEFIRKFRESNPNKTVWLYTGFTYEEILTSDSGEILNYIDVLVDSPFEEEHKDISCRFRGSTNQRLIDVKDSLEKGHIIEFS